MLRSSCMHLLLYILYVLNTVAKEFELFDMTGKMPGVEKVGVGYLSRLCNTKPQRMLDPERSSGYNIRECLQNTSSKCYSTETENVMRDHFDSNRRELLKRVPMKKRKRREQGWLPSHPNQQDYELIDKHVFSSRKSCFIISKECIESGISDTELYEYKSNFPSFEKRSWGSCALVGLSDDMLLREYGKDIDAHDVVIRMGHIPVTRYKKYVGSRSDIVIFRPGALKRDQRDHIPSDVKAYLCKNPLKSKLKFSTVKDSSSIYCDKRDGMNDFSQSLLIQLYKSMLPNKRSTTGTQYAIRLAFSRLCARLDIYGISSGGGGTYFEPEALTKSKHGTELDSWLLHYLMKNYDEELRTCIYI